MTAPTEPTPSRNFPGLGTIVAILAAIVAVAVPILWGGVWLGRLEAKVDNLTTAINRLDDSQNPYSLRSTVNSNTQEVRRLAAILFPLIGRLHPGQRTLVRQAQSEYFGTPAPGGTLSLPLPPLPNPQVVYIGPSDIVPGMYKVVLPPEHLGERVAVVAMRGGKVLSVATDEAGFKVVDIAQEYGYRLRYGNLKEVTVTPGVTVTRNQPLGYAIPTPEACVRIGILDANGRFIDPRPFLPPMMEAPPRPK